MTMNSALSKTMQFKTIIMNEVQHRIGETIFLPIHFSPSRKVFQPEPYGSQANGESVRFLLNWR